MPTAASAAASAERKNTRLRLSTAKAFPPRCPMLHLPSKCPPDAEAEHSRRLVLRGMAKVVVDRTSLGDLRRRIQRILTSEVGIEVPAIAESISVGIA